jgi:hypothetical protein
MYEIELLRVRFFIVPQVCMENRVLRASMETLFPQGIIFF